MPKIINYTTISSVEELRRNRQDLQKEIAIAEKKIRNDYSVFKSSFTLVNLVGSAIRKVYAYAGLYNSAKLAMSLISKILPQPRKLSGDS